MASRNVVENEIDLTLFVACYNEAKNIVTTLKTLLEALKEVDFTWEIIVIDDASQDNSVQIIQEFLQLRPDLPIRLATNEQNRGLAQNYVDGAFLGRGKYYRLICGDNSEPHETLVEVFKQLGKSELVLFYHVENIGRGLFRRVLSRTFTGIVNALSGYRLHYYNGLAIHTRYNVMRWHSNFRGFGFQADLVTRLLDQGCAYVEVPVKVTERTEGSSTALRLNNILSVLHTLLDISIRRVGRLLYGKPRPRGRMVALPAWSLSPATIPQRNLDGEPVTIESRAAK
ncbi:MAG: glycosyltransferase family 2 protein [Gemmataceae bacterium]|nr:glycosyltransferase family 2 protein [Gemmataceae bacterium]